MTIPHQENIVRCADCHQNYCIACNHLGCPKCGHVHYIQPATPPTKYVDENRYYCLHAKK